ncbi:hypothetical protein PBI_SCTP2_449 [Salicola phage SCTP-2]|nr:hypothetical protein PBI_SCTP2_449 [Salicola phage SCTP-2]
MSYSKINKYGVPISQERDIRQGLQQPKFSNRFRARFQNLGQVIMNTDDDTSSNELSNDILTGSVESFTKPTFTFEKQTSKGFISTANYSGRPSFDDFTIVIRDEITNTVIGKIYNQLKMQTYKYQPVTSPDGENLIKSKFLGISTKFDVHIDIMDGHTNHTAIEIWSFYGCQITSLSNTENSYEDSQSITKLNLTCSFDYVDVHQPSRKQFASSYEYEEDKTNAQFNSTSNSENNENNEENNSNTINKYANELFDGNIF